MKLTKTLIAVTATILTAQSFAADKGIKVIYGEDNRVDVYASNNASFVELAKSTAAMVPSTNLKSILGGSIVVSGKTLEQRGVCAKERFSQQMSAANCSGFLVAPDKLVTAGHCITKEADCKNYKWVFDYKVDHEKQGDVTVAASSVVSCKKIIARSLNNFNKDDWAIIELDRKVTDRQPAKFRREGKVSVGAKLVVIGHPTGLPTKIADGAQVRSLSGKYFTANLDTYGGNSGSAVFNVDTEEVEGILVRGDTDYVRDSALGCQVSNRCADTGCRGEDVTFITNVTDLKKIR